MAHRCERQEGVTHSPPATGDFGWHFSKRLLVYLCSWARRDRFDTAPARNERLPWSRGSSSGRRRRRVRCDTSLFSTFYRQCHGSQTIFLFGHGPSANVDLIPACAFTLSLGLTACHMITATSKRGDDGEGDDELYQMREHLHRSRPQRDDKTHCTVHRGCRICLRPCGVCNYAGFRRTDSLVQRGQIHPGAMGKPATSAAI